VGPLAAWRPGVQHGDHEEYYNKRTKLEVLKFLKFLKELAIKELATNPPRVTMSG